MDITTEHTVGLLRSLADAIEAGEAYAFEVHNDFSATRGGHQSEERESRTVRIGVAVPLTPREISGPCCQMWRTDIAPSRTCGLPLDDDNLCPERGKRHG